MQLNTINKNLKKFSDYNEWKNYVEKLLIEFGPKNLAFKNQIVPTNYKSFIINLLIKKIANVIENTLKNAPDQK